MADVKATPISAELRDVVKIETSLLYCRRQMLTNAADVIDELYEALDDMVFHFAADPYNRLGPEEVAAANSARAALENARRARNG